MNIEKQIKKLKGETFLKTIKNYHNGILEISNLLEIVRYAGNEAEPLLSYLVNLLKEKEKKTEKILPLKKLLDKANYDFKICKNKKEQDEIKKYFKKGEELCSFKEDRTKNYYVINCWKKDIKDIKREDFTGKEKRDDLYGTSCMSIQISKKGGFISIKNRYNHKVSNCDNTLNSNPDNIIEGLSNSLKKEFNVDFSKSKVEINGNYHIFKDKILKYNFEMNGVFIGNDFYLKNGELYKIDKSKQMIIDYFILDFESKEIKKIVEANDDFLNQINDLLKSNKVSYENNKIKIGENTIEIEDHKIVYLSLPNLLEIGNDFLFNNNSLKKINLPNLVEIRNGFLFNNNSLKEINLFNLAEIGNGFLFNNNSLKELNLFNLLEIGNDFLFKNNSLKKINLPNLKKVGNDFLYLYINNSLKKINLPNLKKVGNGFLCNDNSLKKINLPNLVEVGNAFLFNNISLKEINFSNLKKVGNGFLHFNKNKNKILTEIK